MIKFYLKISPIFASLVSSGLGCNFLVQDLRTEPSLLTYQKGIFPHYKEEIINLHYTKQCGPILGLEEPRYVEIESDSLEYNLERTDDGLFRMVSKKAPQPEALLYHMIKDQDGREHIINTEDLKYQPHGRVIMTFKNGNCYSGSGVLVGPHHVLTAGHNLFLHKNNHGWATQVTFIPAQDENKTPYGQAQGTILLAFENWVNLKDSTHNMGIIILDHAIGYKTGWAGLFCAPARLIAKHKIHVTGYSVDKGNRTQSWTMQQYPKVSTQEIIQDDINTASGQNRAAIWTEFLGYPGWYVTGIYTHGAENYIDFGQLNLDLYSIINKVDDQTKKEISCYFCHVLDKDIYDVLTKRNIYRAMTIALDIPGDQRPDIFENKPDLIKIIKPEIVKQFKEKYGQNNK